MRILNRHLGRFSARFLFAVAGIVAAVAVFGIVTFQTQRQAIRAERARDLSSVGILKSQQIESWTAERMGDANVISNNPVWNRLAASYIASRDPVSRDLLLTLMKTRVNSYRYESLSLADASGAMALSTEAGITRIGGETRAAIQRAISERRPVIGDFHVCRDCKKIHIEFIAPLSHPGSAAPLGAVILREDPKRYIYPLIQTWPMPSETAETLLVLREGDEVVFLNELRHQKNTALILRHPVSRSDLPAARAVRGVTGIAEGIDYRGVAVLADTRAIPGTPWHLIAKEDIAEVYQPVRQLLWLVIILSLVLIGGGTAFAGYWWKRETSEHYKKLYEAEIRNRALVFHFEYLTRYANDIIILADETLHIIEANDRAVSAYGFSREELFALDVHRLRLPGKEDEFDKQIRIITNSGSAIYETTHVRKDGTAFPVEVSARLIDINDKKFFQAIIRDITERKRAEQALVESQRMFATLISNLPGFVYRCRNDRDWTMAFISDGCLEITGYPPEDFIDNRALAFNDIVDPDRQEELWAKWQRCLAAREAFEDTYRILPKTGPRRWVWERGRGVFSAGGDLLFLEGFITDVTALKNAQDDLRDKNEELSAAYQQLEAAERELRRNYDELVLSQRTIGEASSRWSTTFNAINDPICLLDPDGVILQCNDAYRALVYQADDGKIGQRCHLLVHNSDRYLDDCPFVAMKGSGARESRELNLMGRWFAVTVDPVPGADGTLAGAVHIMTDITARKEAEEQRRLNEARFSALYELGRMYDRGEAEIIGFALEEGVRLTGSEVGYLQFIEEGRVSPELFIWPNAARERCSSDTSRHNPIESAGIWADPFRLRRPVIHNDYPNEPDRRGYPDGHFPVRRHMSVPVIDGGAVTLVAGVGNKTEPYDESDARQLELLMDGMWRVLQRRRLDERITASLREKDVLLKEIHHRVKNNMQVIASMINLQFHDFEKSLTRMPAEEISRELQNRIRAMAMIHERLYQSDSFSKINFGDYARKLCDTLFHSYKADTTRISLAIETDDIILGIDAAIPCGLIINELVSNALKYAFPGGRAGTITVTLQGIENGVYRLRIGDDGIGMPEDINVETTPSLGLRLVSLLTQQIRGTLAIDRRQGTTVTIDFIRTGNEPRKDGNGIQQNTIS